MGRKVIFWGCLRVTQRVGQATPILFCREVLDSFWACAKPGKTHQDRTGERGRNGSTPGSRVR